jgi:hypothetical protein
MSTIAILMIVVGLLILAIAIPKAIEARRLSNIYEKPKEKISKANPTQLAKQADPST